MDPAQPSIQPWLSSTVWDHGPTLSLAHSPMLATTVLLQDIARSIDSFLITPLKSKAPLPIQGRGTEAFPMVPQLEDSRPYNLPVHLFLVGEEMNSQ